MSSSYLASKKEKAYDDIAFEIYDSNMLGRLDNVTEEDDGSSSSDNSSSSGDKEEPNNGNGNANGNGGSSNGNSTSGKNAYIGTLEIPKINVKKGFVDPSSKYNDISYNVTIIETSVFPDVENGAFILAAHSGSGPLAYFKDLYKLKVGDKAYISYKGVKYTYKIVKIYKQKKQGYVTIYRDVNKTTLALITCTKGDKKSQTVYIAERI